MKKCLETSANKGDPQLRRAVGEIIHRISATLPALEEPITMYLAGGMAVNFYTGYRSTIDKEAAAFSALLLSNLLENKPGFRESADKMYEVYKTIDLLEGGGRKV